MRRLAPILMVLGVGLFIFCLFGFSVSGGSDPVESSIMGTDAWGFRVRYALTARIGLGVGGTLIAAGWLGSRRVKNHGK